MTTVTTAFPAEAGQDVSWQKYPILLLLAGLCVYYNSFGGTFFMDDHTWIVYNPDIGKPFAFFLGFRWLVSLSLTGNYWLDGLNPRGYHLFNLAVHLLAGLTLFGIIRRTLLLPQWTEPVRKSAGELAFVIALLWLIHPLNTQAVTYVIQRCESLMGLFYLLTLYCVLRGASAVSGRWWFAGAVLCCALAQGCKEVALTIPVVVWLYDWTFLAPRPGLLRRRGGLYLALWIPPLVHLSGYLASGVLVSPDNTLSFYYPGSTPFQYALTQTGVVLYYLQLSVCPSPLCLDYCDWPVVQSVSECSLSLLVIGALLLGTLVAVVRRSWLGFLGAWFFLILAPSSSILPIQDRVFEHRLYLSLAAVIALGVGGFAFLLARVRAKGNMSSGLLKVLTAGIVIFWCLVLGGLTIARNATFCSFAGMFLDIAGKRPANYRSQETLAQIYLATGDVETALEHLRITIQLQPNYTLAHRTLGKCLVQKGQINDAVAAFTTGLSLHPKEFVETYLMLLGWALLLRGDQKEAITQLQAAARLKPGSVEAQVLLALALGESGRAMEAEAIYQEVLRLEPGCGRRFRYRVRAEVFDPKANAITLRESLLLAQAAVRLSGEKDIECLDLLAISQAANGRFPEAQESCQRAIARAEAAGQSVLAGQMRQRLELYRKKLTYQQSSDL